MNPLALGPRGRVPFVYALVAWMLALCLAPLARAEWSLRGVGFNSFNQLGAHPKGYVNVPVSVADDVGAMAVGGSQTVFSKEDGTLWIVGSRWMLGEDPTSTPVQLASGVVRFASGGAHVLWIDETGALWALGSNSSGQLGDGSTVDRLSPVVVATGVARVAVSETFSLFVKTDGSLWGMGENGEGQLGDGSWTNRSSPVPIANGVRDVAAGSYHSLFVKTDGSLWGMGRSYNRQLGDVFGSEQVRPVWIADDVRAAAAGSSHSLFLKNDGGLWALGANHYGQLGTGDQMYRASPVLVANEVGDFAAGQDHSIFIKTDHSLWITGVNPWQKSRTGGTVCTAPVLVEWWAWGVASRFFHTVFLQDPVPRVSASAEVLLAGQTVTLAVSPPPAGATWTYQWFHGGAGGDAEPIPGATAATLSLPVPAGDHVYWARVFNEGYPADTEAVRVSGCAVPSLVVTPVTVALAAAGERVELHATAAGGALDYQWFEGERGDTGRPVAGATGPMLLSRPITGATSFWLRVRNLAGSTDGETIQVSCPAPRPADVFAVGANGAGQLGVGPNSVVGGPIRGMGGVVKAVGGAVHSLFLDTEGRVWGSGGNQMYQFGASTPSSTNQPVQIASEVADIAAIATVSVVLKKDGTLRLAGTGTEAQLEFGQTFRVLDSGVAAMATGRGFVCYIKTDGTLWGWGDNGHGQLGDGSLLDVASPTMIASEVRSVAAGPDTCLFLKTDGTLWGSGRSELGQLGVVEYDVVRPRRVALDVRAVWADDHTLFLKTDGALWGLGANASGQIGGVVAGAVAEPRLIASDVRQAAAGDAHTLLLKTDGTVWSLGSNASGQLGRGVNASGLGAMPLGTVALGVGAGHSHSLFLRSPPPEIVSQPSDVVLAPGESAGLSVEAISQIAVTYQWYQGESGDTSAPVAGATNASFTSPALFDGRTYWVRVRSESGAADSRSAAVVLPPAVTLVPPAVASPQGWPLFLRASASGGSIAYQWFEGETGDVSAPVAGATGATLVMTPFAGERRLWVRVRNPAGDADSAAVTLGAAAPVARGLKSIGDQNLSGVSLSSAAPVPVAEGVVRMAGGNSGGRPHELFVKADNTLWGLGHNANGQLGDGSTVARSTAVQVAGEVRLVSTGTNHSLFVKTDGSLWAMGGNSAGQLGDGTLIQRERPVAVAADVVSASAGPGFSLYLTGDGRLWGMGYNANGQLGDGTTATRMSPVPIADGVAWAGTGTSAFTLFIKRDGSLWGMGQNSHGQLVPGGAVSQLNPVLIARDVVQAAAGDGHVVCLKSDGSLWGVGLNTSGQLGDGTTIGRDVPVLISGDVVRVAAAGRHTLYLKSDYSLWGAGSGDHLQLGAATSATVGVPVAVWTRAWEVAAARTRTLVLLGPSPSIVTQPQTVAVAAGTSASLSVVAEGPGPIRYQWYRSISGGGALIEGATGATYTTPADAVAGLHQYRVRVSNDDDFTDSAIAFVTVCTPPVFSPPLPNSVTVDLQGKAALSAYASGGLVSYRWYVGESGDTTRPVDDATSATFTTPALSGTVRYWVRATNVAGTADSSTVVVLVRPGISTQPASVSVPLGDPVTLTVAAGGSAPLSYQWYRGAKGVTDDPVEGATGASFTFTPDAGERSYWVRVTNDVDRADSVAAVVVGATSPTIVAQPAPFSLGAHAGMARVEISGGALTYQWYRGEVGDESAPVPDASGALLLLSPMDPGGRFWVRATNVAGAVDGESVEIEPVPVRPLELWAMGANGYGQLGIGSKVSAGSPVRVASDVVATAAGGGFSLFLKADGTLWGMGYNNQSQLGSGAFSSSQTTPVFMASDVVAVAAGGSHALFLKRDGALWSSGLNTYGQRGPSSVGPAFNQIAGGVARLAAGGEHTLFIKRDASLWALGYNFYGQLGVGNTGNQYAPVRVADGVVAVSGGLHHSAYLDASGQAWAMGYNSGGELGVGGSLSRTSPVLTLADVTEVSAGALHTLWRRGDGSMWASGSDTGQFGLGSATGTRRQPVQVQEGGVALVAAGSAAYSVCSLFIKTDTSLWGMGSAASGQLGLGSTGGSTVYSPARVVGGAVSVSAGGGHTLFLRIPPPRFGSVPAEVGALSGGSATLSVAVEAGEAPVSLQWYVGVSGDTAAPLAGAETASFTTPPLFGDAHYWVRATSPYGSADSTTIRAVICTRPSIIDPPTGAGVLAGQDATLQVGASGGALSYQWYRGASGDTSDPVEGADGAKLKVRAPGSDGRFWVRVTNLAGHIDSPSVEVRVLASGRLLTMGNPLDGRLGLGESIPPATVVAHGIVRAAAGSAHSLRVDSAGRLWGVGENGSGQLGIGHTSDQNSPVQIASGVRAVAAGADHSLFIKTDDTLWAMGANGSGQLGLDNTINRLTPVQIATGVLACAAGDGHSVWLTSDGSLWTVGANAAGQLAVGDTTDRGAPTLVLTDVAAIAAGGGNSFAIKTDGTLWGAGLNDAGQLGLGDTDNRSGFVALASDVAAVAAGDGHTWLLKTDGTLHSTGRGELGQLADGTAGARSVFASVRGGVRSIFAAGDLGFFVTMDGTLLGVGDNEIGQLGLGHADPVTEPESIRTDIVAVSSGGEHSFFLASDGRLLAAGADERAQWGDGAPDLRLRPTPVPVDAVAVAAGGRHTVFIKPDGSLWGFGDNAYGQLGASGKARHRAPVWIADGVADVLATRGATYYIKTDGELWILGAGVGGASSGLATRIATAVRQVADGGNHLLFVKTDDRLWGMGMNLRGQLGDALARTYFSTPQPVADGVREIAAGGPGSVYGVSAYIKTDGTLWTFGSSAVGQLGNGSSTVGTLGAPPTWIASNVSAVMFGEDSLYFVREDGSLWVSGSNASGQLGGVGLGNFVLSPVQVAQNVAQVSSASGHLLVLDRDGSIWGAGFNLFGQLGVGDMIDRRAGLVRIVERGGLAVSAGTEHSALLVVPPPVIELDPSPRVVRLGQRVEFSVVASGVGSLDYQWRRDGDALEGAGARTAKLVIEAAEFADGGDYDVVVSFAGVPAKSAVATLVVHDEAQTSFAAWAAAHGVGGDPLADPEGDTGTVPALLRYAFKLDARGPVTPPLASALERVPEDASGAPFLTLTFPRKAYAPGLRYVVEVSADLVSWAPIRIVTPGWPELVTVWDTEPVSAGAPRRFMRVRAELAP